MNYNGIHFCARDLVSRPRHISSLGPIKSPSVFRTMDYQRILYMCRSLRPHILMNTLRYIAKLHKYTSYFLPAFVLYPKNLVPSLFWNSSSESYWKRKLPQTYNNQQQTNKHTRNKHCAHIILICFVISTLECVCFIYINFLEIIRSPLCQCKNYSVPNEVA